MSTISIIMENAATLTSDERIDLVISLLQGLKAKTPEPKAKKAKKEASPDTEPKPKRESNYFIKATSLVRDILKPTIEAYNANLGPDQKKLLGTAPVRVSSMLKDAGLLSESLMPTPEQVQSTFQAFLANPPEIKPKKASPVTSDSEVESIGEKKKAKHQMIREDNAAKKKMH
jgi:hypothetical protein